MTTKMWMELLVRIGLALAAGVLIGLVPLEIRRVRFAGSPAWKVAHGVVAALALAGFVALGWWLVKENLPKWLEGEPKEAAYPTAPMYPETR